MVIRVARGSSARPWNLREVSEAPLRPRVARRGHPESPDRQKDSR